MTDYRKIQPAEAWSPLPESRWNEENARHLLRRIGFSATPKNVALAVEEGMSSTIEKFFGQPRTMPVPASIAKYVEANKGVFQNIRQLPEEERKRLVKRLRRDGQKVYLDYGIEWLRYARILENSPYEKLVMFLQDVLVTGLPKVRNPYLLFQHQNLLRSNATDGYAEICKKVSRSPAMIHYLDLQQSKRGSPNENFARELFELFTLGEGSYTEADIKEAARAFTGYRSDGFQFRYALRLHDDGNKSVFGKRGDFGGDDVIDLIFEQPAAQTFLPNEFLRFYLSSEITLDPAYLEVLGKEWSRNGFEIGFLLRTVFTSRIFYHPQFRGNMIKSPVQFFVGMLQDLNLEVAPLPGIVMNVLRNMGQPFYAPPNVRGWVGGKSWINSSTLSARRQLVEGLFNAIDEGSLNADDLRRLKNARSNSPMSLTVNEEKINRVAALKDEEMVDHLAKYLLSGSSDAQLRATFIHFLQDKQGHRTERVRDLLIALMQSPQYQLC